MRKRGTLFINLSGSLAIGLFIPLAAHKVGLSPLWGLFVATGILGGFTTFSTFSVESVLLLREGAVLQAAAYILASTGGGLLAAMVGFLAGQWLLSFTTA